MRTGVNRPVVAFNMYMPPELKHAMQEVLRKEGRPMGRVVEDLISQYVTEHGGAETGAGVTGMEAQ